MTANSKFIQPADGIVVVRSHGGPTLLESDLIEIGRQRVAAGEDPDEVALDLAQWLAALDPDQPVNGPSALAAHAETIHDVADAHVAKIETAVRFAFARGRAAIDRSALRNATGLREASHAVAKAPDAVKEALQKTLPPQLVKTFTAGGEFGVSRLSTMKRVRHAAKASSPLKMSFNAKNERSAEWAREHAAELIDDLTETTRQAIADAIVRGFETGKIGQVQPEILDALLEDEVLGSVGDDERANMIARTESMRAANGGQREAWNQAVESGLLTGDEKRVWIVAEDSCPDCDALDGETADLDGEYEDGGEGPPLHPNCRCTEGLTS